RPLNDAPARYTEFLTSLCGHRLDGVTMALDCGHGAAYQVGPDAFRGLGAHVVALGVSPDGTNINRGYGALHLERLQEAVVSERAQVGVALDGDADRVVVVDEHGD